MNLSIEPKLVVTETHFPDQVGRKPTKEGETKLEVHAESRVEQLFFIHTVHALYNCTPYTL